MTIEEFEKIVQQTLKDLPKEFKSKLDNVDILVEIWPKQGDSLFGLYRGIPKTKRGSNYSGVLPDKIVIFAGPILSLSKSEQEARKQIKDTVLHELGHYFGMSEAAIRKAQKENE